MNLSDHVYYNLHRRFAITPIASSGYLKKILFTVKYTNLIVKIPKLRPISVYERGEWSVVFSLSYIKIDLNLRILTVKFLYLTVKSIILNATN